MDKEQRVNELIQKYYDKFGTFFPIVMEAPLNDDEIIKAIGYCLETGEPYKEPDYEIIPDVFY